MKKGEGFEEGWRLRRQVQDRDDSQNCWGKSPTQKAGEGKWLDVILVKEAAT